MHGSIGYLWRYVGNAGGLGIAFFSLLAIFKPRQSPVVLGVGYGVFVFVCLCITLFASPNGQQLMFEVTPLSFSGGLLGHVVFGFVLGQLALRHSRRALQPARQPFSGRNPISELHCAASSTSGLWPTR